MSLLALCGAKQELAIRRVPLSDAAHQAVDEVFASQEATFRRGEERPFDQNWRNDPKSRDDIPAVLKGLQHIWSDEELRARMHEDVHDTAQWLGKVVNGWLNYYAVPTSAQTLCGFIRRLEWILAHDVSQKIRTTIAHVRCLATVSGFGSRPCVDGHKRYGRR